MRSARKWLIWLSVFVIAMTIKTLWNRHSATVRVTERCVLGMTAEGSVLDTDDALPICTCSAKVMVAEQSLAMFIPIIGRSFYKETSEAKRRELVKDKCLTIGRVFES